MSSRIVGLSAANVKKLKAVRVTPDGATVVIGGRNGQGKTSLLDCISMALGGKDEVQSEPIRRGQTSAKIVLETDELIVTRKFTAAGSTLEVTNKEGLKFPSPQAVLDKLTTSLAFDPLAFTRADPKSQLTQLRALVGIDTTDIDAKRKEAFDERTMRNREVKAQRGVVEALPETGPVKVDIQALVQELDAAREHNRGKEAIRRAIATHAGDMRNRQSLVENAAAKIMRLEQELVQARVDLESRNHDLKVASEALASTESAYAGFVEVATEDLTRQLGQAESTNQAAARVEQRKSEQAKLEKIEAAAKALTTTIETLDSERTKLLESAKFPVPGLGLAEGGVTLNDIPLEQASSAEQLRVGLAVACAMNPKLKVMLIRDGSLLDAESMKLVNDLAEANDAQVWLEVVTDDAKRCTVIIEDGEVQAAEAPKENPELALA